MSVHIIHPKTSLSHAQKSSILKERYFYQGQGWSPLPLIQSAVDETWLVWNWLKDVNSKVHLLSMLLTFTKSHSWTIVWQQSRAQNIRPKWERAALKKAKKVTKIFLPQTELCILDAYILGILLRMELSPWGSLWSCENRDGGAILPYLGRLSD